MGFPFVHPERPCSLPVMPRLFRPDQIKFEGRRGSEVLEIEYIIYN